MQYGTRANEADSGNDLRSDPGVVTGVLRSQLIGEQRKHCRSQTDKKIGTQAGRAMLTLTFQSDQAPEERGQAKLRDVNPE
jgi:hypothetical protein